MKNKQKKYRVADIVDSIDHNDLNEEEAEILTKAVKRIKDKRRKSFEKTLRDASRIVKSWPEWKQNAL